MTTMTMSGVLLTVHDVARELNKSNVEVLRLIARRALKAARTGTNRLTNQYGEGILGQGGSVEFRVAPSDLADYIQRGAPDIEMPPLKHSWLWDDALARATEQFVLALNAASEEQAPESGQLAAEWEGQRAKVGLIQMEQEGWMRPRPLAITPKLRAVIDSPPPLPGSPFRTWLDAAIVHWLRAEARDVVVGKAGLLGGLAYFYRSPEDYRQIATDAWTSLIVSYRKGMSVIRVLPMSAGGGLVTYTLATRDLLQLRVSAATGRVDVEEYFRLAF
jgi:hypothetical protein